MKEKQVFRSVSVVALVGLFLSLVLVSCQSVLLSVAQQSEGSAPATRTPFQAQSPTPRPTITPTPTMIPSATLPPCLSDRGQIESHTLEFSNPAQPLTFRVYLPPCYGVDAGVRYPVLYLIHGQTYTEDQWDRLGVDEVADTMIAAKEIPPFLVVMPLEANTFEDIFSASFGLDLVDGLVPWIDANYLTCAERTCRAIGGLSRGGAWALRLGFIHWDIFGAIGLHSTPPFIGDPNRLPAWLNEIPPDQLPRVYMDTGKRDGYINSTSEFESMLVRYAVPHEWYLFNGTHEEAYWSAHVPDYLVWYTQPWWNSGQ